MSPKFKQEILSILRVKKAYGETITEDTVSTVIKSYTKGMTKDDNVFAPNIEDKHLFGRRQYFSVDEIINNREALADAMAESRVYSHLLTGGTVLDTTISQLGFFTGSKLSAGVRSMLERLGAGSELTNSEYVSDSAREAIGKKVFRMELSYKPIIESFNATEPRFLVGYEDDMGAFQSIEINGQPWILEKGYNTSKKSELRLQAKNGLFVVSKSGASMKDRMRAEISYLATLDHFDEDLLFNGSSEFTRNFLKILGRDNALNLFREKKAAYEGTE